MGIGKLYKIRFLASDKQRFDGVIDLRLDQGDGRRASRLVGCCADLSRSAHQYQVASTMRQ